MQESPDSNFYYLRSGQQPDPERWWAQLFPGIIPGLDMLIYTISHICYAFLLLCLPFCLVSLGPSHTLRFGIVGSSQRFCPQLQNAWHLLQILKITFGCHCPSMAHQPQCDSATIDMRQTMPFINCMKHVTQKGAVASFRVTNAHREVHSSEQSCPMWHAELCDSRLAGTLAPATWYVNLFLQNYNFFFN